MKRRDFLQFLGASGMLMSLPPSLISCASKSPSAIPFLDASTEDKLLTAEGLNYKILMRWGDKINQTQKFGFNNDYLAYTALEQDRAILWVNHEYALPAFIGGPERTKKNVDLERLEVGGSLIEIKKVNGDWKLVNDSAFNRRLDATTKIPFAWDSLIAVKDHAIGTLSNCAGGQTPWGTILTCEENYYYNVGERERSGKFTPSYLTSENWEKHWQVPPEHYGWVVEVEPRTGKAKKLVSLGRFAHECATIARAKDGKIVAYSGEDSINEHLYKFISNSSDSLERGILYVADLDKGKWVSLDINQQPELKKNFKNQTEIQIFTRDAAKFVGATPLDRPEDIDIDPLTGNVFVALSNNKPKNNFHGSILKIIESNGDHGSLTFKHESFLTGGKKHGFACPDNMVFDKKGNLWITTDISDREIEKGPYAGLGNNGLFVFLRSGPSAGEVIRVASAPNQAEFTGPCFSPDEKTLFLSVQHPGESTVDLNNPTSRWPDGGIPKPCVVTLQGPLLDKIVGGQI